MPGMLDVYLFSDLVGRLVQDAGGPMGFDYAEGWLGRPGAVPLSHSLPLRPKRFRSRECRGFFAGLLPEAAQREIIAQNLGARARDDYAMLERIGGECAGAVTLMPTEAPLPEGSGDYHALTMDELAGILQELPARPLLAGDEGIRQSLAGTQAKIAVRLEGDDICLPLGNGSSTHILKPAVAPYEGLVYNEALCLQLAAAIGLPAAPVEIRSIDRMDYLLVERYDRYRRSRPGGPPVLERLHQEDFCQALGIVPEHKYQKEGGPSLQQCFALLRELSSTPVVDLARLLDAVIYNYLVGNNDAHGKNFSLLYTGVGADDVEIRLAPLYDIVCTAFYPDLSRELAMKIGGECYSENVTPKHFEKLAEEAGLGRSLVRRRVSELAGILLTTLTRVVTANPVAKGVVTLIRQRAEKAQKFS